MKETSDISSEREAVCAQRDGVVAERDAISAQRDAAIAERDEAKARLAKIEDDEKAAELLDSNMQLQGEVARLRSIPHFATNPFSLVFAN